MSRIGKKPVDIPAGVKVTVADGGIVVEGKSKLSMTLPPHVIAEVKENQVLVSAADESRAANAMHGLARSLIQNMDIGVSQGFKKELQIVGIGYKAAVAGNKLNLSLGYSHPIEYVIPAGVKIAMGENNTITITGADKQKVGQAAATIRGYRPPEPYKGKGVRYVDEHVTIKEGKTVG